MKRKAAFLKRISAVLFATIICSMFTAKLYASADNGSTIVHVTRTGSKYHLAGCSYLQSDIEITLRDAYKNGYTPCTRCKPPVYNGTSINKDSEQSIPNYKARNSDSRMKVNRGENSSNTSVIVLFVLSIGTVAVLVVYIKPRINKRAVDGSNEKKLLNKNEYRRQSQLYYDLYAGKEPLSMVNVPEGVFLKNGYPSTVGEGIAIYGKYTVYVGKRSKVFHCNPQCGGNRLEPINYYLVWNYKHCPKCAMLKGGLPELKWYFEYLEIERIKEEYNIP